MGLIKTRPSIALLGPPFLPAGRSFEVRVRLDCPQAVPVDVVNIELRGIREVLVDSANHYYQRDVFVALRAACFGKGELSAGQHERAVQFELPADAPGTFEGWHYRIRYRFKVHVDIPWWPDARASYVLPVRWPVLPPPEKRSVYVSRLEGPRFAAPYAEITLHHSQHRPGDTVEGAIALSNVANVAYRGVQFSLLAREQYIASGSKRLHDTRIGRWRPEFSSWHENTPQSFALTLPEALTPSFIDGPNRLEYKLAVRVDIARARDLRFEVPLHVVDPDLTSDTPTAVEFLPIGAQRERLIWERVARETSFTYEGNKLRLRVGAHAPLELSVERRQLQSGVALNAELYFASPELGPALGLDIEHDSPHPSQITARDAEHQRHLREALAPSAPSRRTTVRLAYVSGDRLVFSGDSSGLHEAELRAFVDELERRARALHAALARLPPPASMLSELDAWREAARQCDGNFDPAVVAIVAQSGMADDPHDLLEYGVRARFEASGALGHIEAFVRSFVAIDREHRGHFAREQLLSPNPRLGPTWHPEKLEALEIETLVVDPEGLVARMSADTPPLKAMTFASGLETLVRTWRGQLGGYRG